MPVVLGNKQTEERSGKPKAFKMFKLMEKYGNIGWLIYNLILNVPKCVPEKKETSAIIFLQKK